MSIAVIYNDNFNGTPFDNFRDELLTQEIDCELVPVPSGGVFAGIEAYLPTAIVVWIGAQYFGPMIQELGKNHAKKIKPALEKLFASVGNKKITLIGSAGKLSRNFPYSMTMSLQGKSKEGVKIKLLLQDDLSVKNFGEVSDVFLNFLHDYHNDHLSDIELEELKKARNIGNMLIAVVNLETMKIEFPDPITDFR